MRYFIDTEFIEYPHTIDLISLGIVSESGKTLYAESTEFDETKASPWVKENVISQLKWCNWRDILTKDSGNTSVIGNCSLIRDAVLEFIHPCPEFWGYYSDYDWVVFCWLFGTMMDLPKGWPMYCRDLKQLADTLGKPKFPEPTGEHNALVDAKWSMEFYNYLTKE